MTNDLCERMEHNEHTIHDFYIYITFYIFIEQIFYIIKHDAHNIFTFMFYGINNNSIRKKNNFLS